MNNFKSKYFQQQLMKIKPLIVSGPSGVGKGSLVQKLLQQYQQSFTYSVSYTTRQPRPGEINGVHYNFVTEQIFKEEILKSAFLEHCNVHGNMYGTHKEQIQKIISNNKIPLIEIDVQGAEKINTQLPNQCNNIFIMPPSIEILKQRLSKRGTETQEVIDKRIRNATNEIEKAKQLSFYHFIVNDNFDICYQELLQLIQQKYQLK